MAVFKLQLTTLSPLHIGDGIELRQDFDFIVNNEKTYRLDENAILEAKYAELQVRPGAAYTLPGKLLTTVEDYRTSKFFRYVLPGKPRSSLTDARLRSCLKDVHDWPYIPGSSLKGALRTALGWSGWDEVITNLDRSSFGTRDKWAGQPLEKKLFGKDPNHDLLRALQVSDCQTIGDNRARMILVNAQVLTHSNHGSPIELEAISPNQIFEGRLHIDERLFGSLAEPELGFAKHRHWLDELLPRINRRSQGRLEKLVPWFESVPECEVIANFLRKLQAAEMGENKAILQMGWGTGWDGTTFGSHLQKNPDLFETLVREFRMNKPGRTAPPRRPGSPFPSSRRVAVKMAGNTAHPAAPLGWVLMELEKIS